MRHVVDILEQERSRDSSLWKMVDIRPMALSACYQGGKEKIGEYRSKPALVGVCVKSPRTS